MIRSGTASAYLLRSVRLLLEAYAGAELPQWDAPARTIHSVHLRGGRRPALYAGEVHPYVYYVEEGLLKAQMVDACGRTVITFFAEEGESKLGLDARPAPEVSAVSCNGSRTRADELRVASRVSASTRSWRSRSRPRLRLPPDHLGCQSARPLVLAGDRAVDGLRDHPAQADAVTLRNSAEQRYRQLLDPPRTRRADQPQGTRRLPSM